MNKSRLTRSKVISVRLRIFVSAIASSALTVPTDVFADSTIAPQSITYVNVYAGTSVQGANIQFSPAQPNIEGCSYVPGNLVRIDFSSATQPDGRVLYATVLAAILAGKTPIFSVRGCVNGQVPLVYAVQVNP